GQVVLKFEGIDSRTHAEELRNAAVKIKQEELIDLPDGSYYEFELIGCVVSTEAGETLGEVKEIMQTGAAPVLVIANGNGGEYLVPLAEEICTEIDIHARKIKVAPPEGLLDL